MTWFARSRRPRQPTPSWPPMQRRMPADSLLGRACCSAASSRLLLGRFVVGIGAGRVVGDVDDPSDLDDRLAEGDFDPLAQGHRRHAAARAATAQAEVGGLTLHRHEIGPTTVCCNARVDLLFEDLYDPLRHVPAEVHRWPGHPRACPGGARWLVGVLDDHPDLVCVAVDVEDRPPNSGDAVGRNHEREPATFVGPVIGSGVANRLEVHVVGVGVSARTGDLDPEGQRLPTVLAGPQFQHHLQRRVGRMQDGHARGIDVGHGVSSQPWWFPTIIGECPGSCCYCPLPPTGPRTSLPLPLAWGSTSWSDPNIVRPCPAPWVTGPWFCPWPTSAPPWAPSWRCIVGARSMRCWPSTTKAW